MTRIFLLTCTFNEADRYLDCVLSRNKKLVDEIFIYDDQSTDDTVDVAEAHGALVVSRPDNLISFSEHEGQFRQGAWDTFQDICQPRLGDWIIVADADELIIGSPARTASEALDKGFLGVYVKIPEVFAITDSPQVRVDGYWGGLGAPRMFAWRPGGEYSDLTLGCGSTPSYVGRSPVLRQSELQVVHLGYLDPQDRQDKYNRYVGKPGHSPTHVSSILTTPVLESLDIHGLEIWRGHLNN